MSSLADHDAIDQRPEYGAITGEAVMRVVILDCREREFLSRIGHVVMPA